MVVDIYGSKKLFVTEYRQLLAERLLNQLDFDPEKEIRNLELLKLRFDESLLHTCEVMLKDISDSKRINAHIHNEAEYDDGKCVFCVRQSRMSFNLAFDFKQKTPSKYRPWCCRHNSGRTLKTTLSIYHPSTKRNLPNTQNRSRRTKLIERCAGVTLPVV